MTGVKIAQRREHTYVLKFQNFNDLLNIILSSKICSSLGVFRQRGVCKTFGKFYLDSDLMINLCWMKNRRQTQHLLRKPIQIGFNVELLLSLYIVPLGLLQLKSARVHYCKQVAIIQISRRQEIFIVENSYILVYYTNYFNGLNFEVIA